MSNAVSQGEYNGSPSPRVQRPKGTSSWTSSARNLTPEHVDSITPSHKLVMTTSIGSK